MLSFIFIGMFALLIPAQALAAPVIIAAASAAVAVSVSAVGFTLAGFVTAFTVNMAIVAFTGVITKSKCSAHSPRDWFKDDHS